MNISEFFKFQNLSKNIYIDMTKRYIFYKKIEKAKKRIKSILNDKQQYLVNSFINCRFEYRITLDLDIKLIKTKNKYFILSQYDFFIKHKCNNCECQNINCFKYNKSIQND